MLLTDKTWTEGDPVRRAFASPYLPWRCVAWTEEVLNFLIVGSHRMRNHEHLPNGWFVGGPEVLLEVAGELERGAVTVYALDRATDNTKIELCEVTEVWRERHNPARLFWYRTITGDVRPCSGPRRRPKSPSELVREWSTNEDVGDGDADD